MASLELIDQILGSKINLCVAKELTKIHENFFRGTTKEVLKIFNEKKELIKGEFVLVLAPNGQTKPQAPAALDPSAVLTLFKDDGIRLQQAVSLAHKLTGYGKNSLYKMALSIYANT